MGVVGNLGTGVCRGHGPYGLQNAMMSTYSGAVIRTTHVSGMFTDLGIFLGHFLISGFLYGSYFVFHHHNPAT